MKKEEVVQQYLALLDTSLGSMPVAERQEIVREIRMHIHDVLAGSGEPVHNVLQRLGTPQALAAQYLACDVVQRGRDSYSPVRLLRAVLRIGAQSLTGTLVFCFALTGYLTGAGLIVTCFLKPFFPARIGVWQQEHTPVAAGFQQQLPGSSTHEILGWWYIPLALLAGVLLLVGSTLLVRSFLRLSRYVQTRFSLPLVIVP